MSEIIFGEAMSKQAIPVSITSEEQLEELLSRPSADTIELMKRLEGDILILGVAGKVGVTLARTAVRAIEAAGVQKKVIGVARFSDPAARKKLEDCGVETIACDLLDRDKVAELPKIKNVIFMAGRKFGTQGAVSLTWAMNVIVPDNCAWHFRDSNIVMFSTGCVYPLRSAEQGGCTESDKPAPIGEYAQSCLGRERVWEHYANTAGIKVNLFRLNYAVELRYGVIFDIATQIWNGEPVNNSVGNFNALWQGDVNNQAILALEYCAAPASILNITGPETLCTEMVANEIGAIMGKSVTFAGTPGNSAYLNDSALATDMYGYPAIAPKTIIRLVAEWIMSGGKGLGKPTHFEVSDGKF